MNDLNLTHDKAYKKSARVVGEVIDDLEKENQFTIYSLTLNDSEKEPAVLPCILSKYINKMVAVGIAAGYSTNIPPHNLAELIDATIRLIKNPNTRLDTILELVHGPDFSQLVEQFKVVKELLMPLKTGREIVKQDLIIKIGDVIDANQGLGIKEVRDETDRNGIRVVIELSDKANFETVRKFLFKIHHCQFHITTTML
ncbi:hypothetical protein FQA39_LY12895 [Lamprigera yunnana]|nr:hypothetical protein FQA39_LY12895 [Lamprigera yunnana]